MPNEDTIFCEYNSAANQWGGNDKCDNLKKEGELVCEEHSKRMCTNCGEKVAVMECPITLQLVCGRPLCEDCGKTLKNNCISCKLKQ